MDDTGTFLHSVESLRLHVDRRLAELIPPPEEEPGRLGEAAHYALLAPGKRFRPLLTLLAAEAFGAPLARALDVACAMEMVHGCAAAGRPRTASMARRTRSWRRSGC
jgi:geranylgeranyl diphosphate synthase type II